MFFDILAPKQHAWKEKKTGFFLRAPNFFWPAKRKRFEKEKS